MALLTEYALTPDVFDATSYSSSEVCGLHLQTVKEVLLQEGLVRNLRDGEWARQFATPDKRPWHPRAKELLKKLATQHRLARSSPSSAVAPVTDAHWCDDALGTHAARSLTGIIVTSGIANSYRAHPVVSAIESLPTAPWWAGRSPSLRLGRTLAEYQTALALVLRHANHLMFVDPHVDPAERRYEDLVTLLLGAGGRSPAPRLELHRVCYRGSGANRQFLDLSGPVSIAGLSVEVFVWDDFHDRYLISNIAGISVPNGFDTTNATKARTTWTRLGRDDRDDVQREFDPASARHALRRTFTVP